MNNPKTGVLTFDRPKVKYVSPKIDLGYEDKAPSSFILTGHEGKDVCVKWGGSKQC